MPATRAASGTPTLPAIDNKLYQALKADIERRGILVPLLYDAKTKRCLDGVLRLRIAEELNIRNIPKIFVGNLDQAEGEDLRIAVNGLRRQLTREQLQTIIEWSLRNSPEISDREHGRRTGADSKTIGKARRRLESTGDIPQTAKRLGGDGRSRPSSRKPMVFTHHAAGANVAARTLDRLGSRAPGGMSSCRKLRRLAMREDREDELKKSGPTLPAHFDLRCCDFRDLDVEGVAALVIGDPPWHTSKELRQPFAEKVFKVLRPGGFALIYTGHQGLMDFGDHFRAAGLEYRWLITCVNEDRQGAIKSNGSVFTESRIVGVYQKPGKPFKSPSIFRDVLYTPVREKEYFDWQQPVSESVAFVKAFTRPRELVIDLTAGTFTVGAACALVGSRRYLGCEIRRDLVELGKRRVSEALG